MASVSAAARRPDDAAAPDESSSPGSVAPSAEEAAETVAALVRTFVKCARSLGQAGRAEEASRLAGVAWSATRKHYPEQARSINGVMHYLAGHFLADTPLAKESPMPAPDQILDVRSEPPARRHSLIFETYHGLNQGEGFVLVNDHDPKPLYYQFAAEHADQFSWDYLEQGPQTWRVRIGRTA